MSKLAYGLVDLSNIIHSREIGRTPVLSDDGTTYLYANWVFDADVLWNPSANSYTVPAGNLGNAFDPAPTARPGLFPATTDVSLRQYLLQSRRRLLYQVGGVTVLDVPGLDANGNRYRTDALNGPHVKFCTVTALHGDRTFAISIRIEARVNEAAQRKFGGGGDVGFPILLSHRWRRWVDVDEDHFATIYTEGLAQFRTDELLKRGTIPDQYRPQLFHPVPGNCRRSNVRVVATEDGSSCWYSFQDSEEAFNVSGMAQNTPSINANAFQGTPAATRVEAYHQRQLVEPPGLGQPAIIGAIQGGIGAGRGAAVHNRRLRTAGKSPDASVLGNVAGAFANAAFGLLVDAFPTVVLKSTCTVWGNRDSRRGRLAALGVAICLFRVQPFPANAATIAEFGYDPAGKEVSCAFTNTYRWPGAEVPKGNMDSGQTFPIPLGIAPADSLALLTDMPVNGPDGDDTGSFLSKVGLGFQGGPGAATPLPNSGGSRGTFVGRILANGLSSPNALPVQPGAVNVIANVDQSL